MCTYLCLCTSVCFTGSTKSLFITVHSLYFPGFRSSCRSGKTTCTCLTKIPLLTPCHAVTLCHFYSLSRSENVAVKICRETKLTPMNLCKITNQIRCKTKIRCSLLQLQNLSVFISPFFLISRPISQYIAYNMPTYT